jgi:hypothetical protein
MVVLTARVRGLIASDTLADLHPVDEPEAVEQIQRAIDAREPDSAAALAQQVGDLSRCHRAVERGHGFENLGARPAVAVARRGERPQRMIGPGRFDSCAHPGEGIRTRGGSTPPPARGSPSLPVGAGTMICGQGRRE